MHTVFFLEINLFYINITTSRRANAHQARIDLASSLHQTRINQTRTKLAPNSRQTRTKLAPNSHQRSDDQTRIKLAPNSRQTRVKLTPNSRFYLIFENSRCYSEHSFRTPPMTCHIYGRSCVESKNRLTSQFSGRDSLQGKQAFIITGHG